MSKLQLFKDFVNERLAAAALEILGQYEKTLSECQEEICGSEENSAPLQRMLDIDVVKPENKLHLIDVQQLCPPENPQIKEEQELWTSQGGEQLQGLQSDTTDSIFTSPTVKTHCDPEDPNQLPPLYQTPTVENRSTNTTEEQIKAGSNEEDYGAPEPASDFQPPSVTLNWDHTAQSLEEEEEKGDLLPELTDCGLRLLPTRVVKSLVKSRTQAECSKPIPSPRSSPVTCLGAKTSPSPWTRPISSPRSGAESEDISSWEVESKTAEKLYQCEECDKAFSWKSRLVAHRRSHTGEKPYQCEECDKAFCNKSYLVSHRRVHTGEKPYQCDECDRVFSQKQLLVSHKSIHTREKPYQCGGCEKAFRSKGNLIVHRRVHTESYHCEECDKPFSTKSNLVRHRRSHKGEKPYQCQECDTFFSRKSHLVSHRRCHTGEKPYQCAECEKAFHSKSNLVVHRRVHTGEKPFQCKECDKAFRVKTYLMKHQIIHK